MNTEPKVPLQAVLLLVRIFKWKNLYIKTKPVLWKALCGLYSVRLCLSCFVKRDAPKKHREVYPFERLIICIWNVNYKNLKKKCVKCYKRMKIPIKGETACR